MQRRFVNSFSKISRRRLAVRCLSVASVWVWFLALSACNSLTTVENPSVTDQAFLRAPGAMQSWLTGCERQAALTIDQILLGAEVASDNYFNNRTLFNRVFDIPRFETSDVDVATIAQTVARLRSMAEYGLVTVAVADQATTNNQRAELLFFKALALSYAGDYFVTLPAEPLGTPLTSRENYQRAVETLQQAIQLSTDNATKYAYYLLLARVYYHLGDKTNAALNAQLVISGVPNFTRFAQFDPQTVNGATNTMQIALSTGQDEFEPLPRLDFLDPKYYRRSAAQESPVCLLKGEEAFLILAESQLADGQVTKARATLKDMLAVVDARPVELVNDAAEQRGRRGGTVRYPLSDTVKVASSPDVTPNLGYIRSRGAGSPLVPVPIVSGTSVSKSALNNTDDALQMLETLYLMRQEIFMAEGRRMVDLGMKFPLSILEIQNNPQAAASTTSTTTSPRPLPQPQIPSFIPSNSEMNEFTYDEARGVVVIKHNMNRIIVQNRTSPFVVPFQ
jgi:tetratricopeptide (TPR) repeat protein